MNLDFCRFIRTEAVSAFLGALPKKYPIFVRIL